MTVKIAMIGAGSIGFTRRLMRDILSVPELSDTTFSFTDISQANLDMVTRLCQRDIQESGAPARLLATTDRRRRRFRCLRQSQCPRRSLPQNPSRTVLRRWE